MQHFRDRLQDSRLKEIPASIHQTYIAAHQIIKDLEEFEDTMALDDMPYAASAGLDTSKKCLEGTRVEILNEVVDWINNRDVDAPRVFWLSGQAGKGKSAIAHTVAAWAKDLGGLGSCFCFTRDRQAERRHEKMFITIAGDLASCNPLLRQVLIDIVSKDLSLTNTVDIELQWRMFILEPLLKVAGDVVGNLVIVIDALDESGNDNSRKDILRILASKDLGRPQNLRIFLTSRPLPDICDALHGVAHIKFVYQERTTSLTFRFQRHRSLTTCGYV
ncbi:hypothetical protein V8B97DRAFT_928173 [Scleroderma yunnanense]